MILVNVVIDNSAITELLIKDRARFYGIKELDYECYNYLHYEVSTLYRMEVRGDPKMRQLWNPDELEWIKRLCK